MSRKQALGYFALGFGACIAMFAVAAVAALAIISTQGEALELSPGNFTPTPQQLQRALEYLANNAPPPANAAPSGAGSGGGSGGGGPAAEATATPGTPEPVRSGGGTPSAPSSTTSNEPTPQPTTTFGSALTVPTREPFTPPTIVPIQPLSTPRAP